MTSKRNKLESIRQRWEDTTPGPWKYFSSPGGRYCLCQNSEDGSHGDLSLNDLSAAASARVDVPWLLDRVAEVEADWVPTPEAVNALPSSLRDYIVGLETRCDPASEISQIACLRENERALVVRVANLEEAEREYKTTAIEILKEECPDPTERHCACVPVLRIEAKRTACTIDELIKERDKAEVRVTELESYLEDERALNAWAESDFKKIKARVAELKADKKRLEAWVADCQSGMYINCVYCGHRHGPYGETPVAMADVLKEHIEQCPHHPMFKLKVRVSKLETELIIVKEAARHQIDEAVKERNDARTGVTELKAYAAKTLDEEARLKARLYDLETDRNGWQKACIQARNKNDKKGAALMVIRSAMGVLDAQGDDK